MRIFQYFLAHKVPSLVNNQLGIISLRRKNDETMRILSNTQIVGQEIMGGGRSPARYIPI
jgi:hypothetical protein